MCIMANSTVQVHACLAKHQHTCPEDAQPSYQALFNLFRTKFITKNWIFRFLIKMSLLSHCALAPCLTKHQYQCLEDFKASYQVLTNSFLTPFIAKKWIFGFLLKTSPFIPLCGAENLGRHLKTCLHMSRGAQDLILGHFEKGILRVRESAA